MGRGHASPYLKPVYSPPNPNPESAAGIKSWNRNRYKSQANYLSELNKFLKKTKQF